MQCLALTNESGHYKVSPGSLHRVVTYLNSKGVAVDEVWNLVAARALFDEIVLTTDPALRTERIAQWRRYLRGVREYHPGKFASGTERLRKSL